MPPHPTPQTTSTNVPHPSITPSTTRTTTSQQKSQLTLLRATPVSAFSTVPSPFDTNVALGMSLQSLPSQYPQPTRPTSAFRRSQVQSPKFTPKSMQTIRMTSFIPLNANNHGNHPTDSSTNDSNLTHPSSKQTIIPTLLRSRLSHGGNSRKLGRTLTPSNTPIQSSSASPYGPLSYHQPSTASASSPSHYQPIVNTQQPQTESPTAPQGPQPPTPLTVPHSSISKSRRFNGLADPSQTAAINPHVTLYSHGTSVFDAIIRAIQHARVEILYEAYSFNIDNTGTRVMNELIAAARRGVYVVLVYDVFGSTIPDPAVFAPLIQAGGRVVQFNPILKPWAWNRSPFFRNHRKNAVIDGIIGFTGGMNTTDQYVSGDRSHGNSFKDFHTRIIGPSTLGMRDVFRDTLREARSTALNEIPTNAQLLEMVVHYDIYRDFIANAMKTRMIGARDHQPIGWLQEFVATGCKAMISRGKGLLALLDNMQASDYDDLSAAKRLHTKIGRDMHSLQSLSHEESDKYGLTSINDNQIYDLFAQVVELNKKKSKMKDKLKVKKPMGKIDGKVDKGEKYAKKGENIDNIEIINIKNNNHISLRTDHRGNLNNIAEKSQEFIVENTITPIIEPFSQNNSLDKSVKIGLNNSGIPQQLTVEALIKAQDKLQLELQPSQHEDNNATSQLSSLPPLPHEDPLALEEQQPLLPRRGKHLQRISRPESLLFSQFVFSMLTRKHQDFVSYSLLPPGENSQLLHQNLSETADNSQNIAEKYLKTPFSNRLHAKLSQLQSHLLRIKQFRQHREISKKIEQQWMQLSRSLPLPVVSYVGDKRLSDGYSATSVIRNKIANRLLSFGNFIVHPAKNTKKKLKQLHNRYQRAKNIYNDLLDIYDYAFPMNITNPPGIHGDLPEIKQVINQDNKEVVMNKKLFHELTHEQPSLSTVVSMVDTIHEEQAHIYAQQGDILPLNHDKTRTNVFNMLFNQEYIHYVTKNFKHFQNQDILENDQNNQKNTETINIQKIRNWSIISSTPTPQHDIVFLQSHAPITTHNLNSPPQQHRQQLFPLSPTQHFKYLHISSLSLKILSASMKSLRSTRGLYAEQMRHLLSNIYTKIQTMRNQTSLSYHILSMRQAIVESRCDLYGYNRDVLVSDEHSKLDANSTNISENTQILGENNGIIPSQPINTSDSSINRQNLHPLLNINTPRTISAQELQTTVAQIYSQIFLPGQDDNKTFAAHFNNTPAHMLSSNVWTNTTKIQTYYLKAIRSATQSIYITNPYVLPPKWLKTELFAAARRGVAVHLLLSGPGANDVPHVRLASLNAYQQYVNHGINIYEYSERTLHAKIIVVDERHSCVGSFNLDPYSINVNLETTMVFPHNPQMAQALIDNTVSEMNSSTTKHISKQIVDEWPRYWRFWVHLAYLISKIVYGTVRLRPIAMLRKVKQFFIGVNQQVINMKNVSDLTQNSDNNVNNSPSHRKCGESYQDQVMHEVNNINTKTTQSTKHVNHEYEDNTLQQHTKPTFFQFLGQYILGISPPQSPQQSQGDDKKQCGKENNEKSDKDNILSIIMKNIDHKISHNDVIGESSVNNYTSKRYRTILRKKTQTPRLSHNNNHHNQSNHVQRLPLHIARNNKQHKFLSQSQQQQQQNFFAYQINTPQFRFRPTLFGYSLRHVGDIINTHKTHLVPFHKQKSQHAQVRSFTELSSGNLHNHPNSDTHPSITFYQNKGTNNATNHPQKQQQVKLHTRSNKHHHTGTTAAKNKKHSPLTQHRPIKTTKPAKVRV